MDTGETPSGHRRNLLGKLRQLVAHPMTEEPVRSVARAKLDLLSPRRPDPKPGSPLRRAADRGLRMATVRTELIRAAYAGLDPAGTGTPAEAAARLDRARRQERVILDILA